MNDGFALLFEALPTRTQKLALRRLESICRSPSVCPNGVLPGERELSRLVGVSRPTLRIVLRQMEGRNLLHASPRGARVVDVPPEVQPLSRTIACVSSGPQLDHAPAGHRTRGWAYQVHLGMIDSIHRRHDNLLVLHADRLDPSHPQSLRDAGISGVLIDESAAGLPAVRQFAEDAGRAAVPVVCHGDEPWMAPFDRVMSDHRQGARMLTEWLLGRGRRRILRFWLLSEDPVWHRMRDEGYEQAMREHGLEPLPAARPRRVGPSTGGAEPETAEAFEYEARMVCAMLAPILTGPERPDALMTESDGPCFAVARGCRMLSLVPGRDILIVGYDNYAADLTQVRFEPTLPAATVDKHNDRIGAAMVQLLIDRIEGRLPSEPQLTFVPPSLVVTGE